MGKQVDCFACSALRGFFSLEFQASGHSHLSYHVIPVPSSDVPGCGITVSSDFGGAMDVSKLITAELSVSIHMGG